MNKPSQHRAVQMQMRADGALTYLIALPPEDLPPVRPRDLAAAWDAARAAATDDSVIDLALADPDASCWAAAVDGTVGLASALGMSLCLRLLGLVDLLATAPWAKTFVSLRRDGAEIDPALLRAAATLPLTRDARLDEISVQAIVAHARLAPPSPGVPISGAAP
jgi:hypothetical protein